MNDNQSSSVPIWVWLLGGCGLLSLLMACIVAFLAFFGVGFFTASSPVISPPLVTSFPITVESSGSDPVTRVIPTDTPPQTPTPETAEPTIESNDPTSESTPETADPNPTTEDPFADIRQEIAINVIAIRGLPQLEEVNPTALTPAELRERLETDLNEDYSPEESRLDVLTLSAFDFLERDFDLYNFTIDLLTEQIAGFYDPETDEFVVISSSEADFGGLEQFTYAHEFVHALQDQHFALDLISDKSIEGDAAFALRALIEGDATLVQTQYVTEGYFSQEVLLDILASAGSIDSTVFDSAPPFLAAELEFPYITGLEFVQTLHSQGGYAAVDAAWENIPQSTEQIIHPDRYLSGDAPQIVTVEPLTDTLGAGWQQIDEDTLGEFYLRQYLIQQLDGATADTAATGWGGDRYTVYWNEESESIVMVLKLAWDTVADGEEFFAAYENYPANLFGTSPTSQADDGICWQGQDVICLYQVGGETMIVRAPDLATAAIVAAAQN